MLCCGSSHYSHKRWSFGPASMIMPKVMSIQAPIRHGQHAAGGLKYGPSGNSLRRVQPSPNNRRNAACAMNLLWPIRAFMRPAENNGELHKALPRYIHENCVYLSKTMFSSLSHPRASRRAPPNFHSFISAFDVVARVMTRPVASGRHQGQKKYK